MFNIFIDSSVKNLWQGESVLTILCFDIISKYENISALITNDAKTLINSLQKEKNIIFEDYNIKSMRHTFRAMPNMDPTRYRPASESLIRRFISNGFFSIMPIVDINNLASSYLKIPLGIYDQNKILSPNLIYRIGYSSENYFTINSQKKNASGKLVIADEKGVIGSPVADSDRAIISKASKSIVIVGYLPFNIAEENGYKVLDKIETMFGKFFSIKLISKKVILSY